MIQEWKEIIEYFKLSLEIGAEQHPANDQKHNRRLADLYDVLIDRRISNAESIDLAFLMLRHAYKDFKKEQTKLVA
jgi:hypothetical protein